MKYYRYYITLLMFLLFVSGTKAQTVLQNRFAHPPEEAKPVVFLVLDVWSCF